MPDPKDPEKKTKYNFIYSQLVEDENDVLGIIAYSMYKRQKIEYIKNINAKHDREPTEEEFQIFYDISNSDAQLKNYMSQAVDLSNLLVEEVLSGKAKELEQVYNGKFEERVSNLPTFWTGVYQSILGSVAFVLLLGTLFFFIWSLQHGPGQLIEAIFNVEITRKIDNAAKSPPSPQTQPQIN